MEALPDEFDAEALPNALVDGWGLDVETIDYVALGAGSYHWLVRDSAGTSSFVTVDDLDQKAWFGTTRDVVFDGLRRAFDTARVLHEHGLDLVVAPLPARDGATLRRLGPRYTVALFPFVDGRASGSWEHEPAERTPLVNLLARLHRATPAVAAIANRTGLSLPGREHLETGLRELDQSWSGGPFSEPAREALAENAAYVVELLAETDRLAAEVEGRGAVLVITHGEPHAGNVMHAGSRRFLVDWDTVSLAPPERDLWLVVETPDDADAYADATGHSVDADAIAFFRLTWDLKDLAEYLKLLRAPHAETDDTRRAFTGVVSCVTGTER
jgi:spectinomycin phosphotransferase